MPLKWDTNRNYDAGPSEHTTSSSPAQCPIYPRCWAVAAITQLLVAPSWCCLEIRNYQVVILSAICFLWVTLHTALRLHPGLMLAIADIVLSTTGQTWAGQQPRGPPVCLSGGISEQGCRGPAPAPSQAHFSLFQQALWKKIKIAHKLSNALKVLDFQPSLN